MSELGRTVEKTGALSMQAHPASDASDKSSTSNDGLSLMHRFFRSEAAIWIMAVFAVVLMFLVEQVFKPGYFVKSLVKVLLFGGIILVMGATSKKSLPEFLNLRKPEKWKGTLLLGILGEAVILTAFFVLKDKIDLDGLRTSLMTKEGLTKGNCLFILGYIIAVNSFLEEAFFRGFLFHSLAEKRSKVVAALVSSLLFAIYHIGIVSSWFSPILFVVCIVGLASAGLFLQWIEERNDSLFSSWMVHALANGAINSIGAMIILFS